MPFITDNTKTIAVVGGGWYGCHIAIELSNAGHDVTLFERSDALVSQVSGKYGIRLHRGPHYPRSAETRKRCRDTFERFVDYYPDLVHWHTESIYGHGLIDAQGQPSKVSARDFGAVCRETLGAYELDHEEMQRFGNLSSAYELKEPSIATGFALRKALVGKLLEAGVRVRLNTDVKNVDDRADGVTLTYAGKAKSAVEKTIDADFLVNATGYQSLKPAVERPLPGFDVVFQTCIAFIFKDKTPQPRPVSFIVMDGWFPCLMPKIGLRDDEASVTTYEDYILTHGSYTILGSHKDPQEGKAILNALDSSPALPRLRAAAEFEMNRHWKGFSERFEYQGWQGEVMAKPRTATEFRSSLVFSQNRTIHVIGGKIMNIFNASDDVNRIVDGEAVIEENGWKFPVDSTLNQARHELSMKHNASARTTDSLQTYQQFLAAA